MKIKHYCPKCKQEKEIEGMKNNMRALWRLHFDEDLESIQDEINTLRRMVIDRNHLDIDKMFLVSNEK